jgi:hypothetical protein
MASVLPYWARYQTEASARDNSGSASSSHSDPILEMSMVLSLPQSKLLPSELLAFGRNQPSGVQKLQCDFWAGSCTDGQ